MLIIDILAFINSTSKSLKAIEVCFAAFKFNNIFGRFMSILHRSKIKITEILNFRN